MPIQTAQLMARAMVRPGLASFVGGLALVATWTLTRLHAERLSLASATTDSMLPGLLLSLALSGLVVVVAGALVVRWHCLLLLEERPGILAAMRPGAADGHCAAVLLFGAIAAHAAFSLLNMALGVGLELDPNSAPAIVAKLLLGAGLLYCVCRGGLVLPAVALGRSVDLATSWRSTAVGCHRAFHRSPRSPRCARCRLKRLAAWRCLRWPPTACAGCASSSSSPLW